jgi:hypothetical protein
LKVYKDSIRFVQLNGRHLISRKLHGQAKIQGRTYSSNLHVL